ncbi:FAD:protein FMN transferase [Methylosoma difficile]
MTVNSFSRLGKSLASGWLLFVIAGCSPTEDVQKLSGYTQGTTYHLSFVGVAGVDPLVIKKAADAEFARIDQQLSNYRNDSAIEQFNANHSSDAVPVSEEIVSLVQQARTISEASHGCYDLTIKPLFDLWGFKAEQLHIPDDASLQSTLQQVGFQNLETVDASHLRKKNPQLRVDLSSIAQGYSVGRIAALLEQQGIQNYLVEIGGELQTRGEKPDHQPWRVALEKPLPGERTMQKVITLKQTTPMSVMTSGTYRHYFDKDGKRYSHILDAKTGKPVDHKTVSVTVFHANPMEADAWGTALLCLGRTEGIKVADQAGIATLFIEQQGDAFQEFPSAALQQLKTLVIE